ncbi:Carbohydrate sulfotransferase 1 [Holothuria leucospilota]|uniref:Carbohydrate sulfotransferase 1 n=1 Tax=Holothuria leucospilota TaxID=206669 RepID=A0A9Q1H8B4_HOLLE|nr:Carbohydrate sulfotransferase 1 [Holothuria leucospilota]
MFFFSAYSTHFKEAFGIKQRNILSEQFRSSIKSTSDKKTLIFLVSSKRSGSSFVGEYFNKHPNFFYVFEPLQMLTFYVLDGIINNNAFDDIALEVLEGLTECQFNRGFKSPEEWLTRKAPLCTFNEELGKTAMCSKETWYNATEISEVLTDTCLTKSDIAFKLIRIQDLDFLKPFVLNDTYDAKILYLVRDPRGVMNSREGVSVNFDLIRRMRNTSLEVEDMCDTMERNLRYWFDTPAWLQGRLKVIRYEDVALFPLDMGKEIFEFVGHDFDMSVIKWLFLSTQNKNTNELGKGKLFRTSRDSAQRVSSWRKELSWDKILSIQTRCIKAMRMAGYLPIPSDVFLNNFSIPSLLPYK